MNPQEPNNNQQNLQPTEQPQGNINNQAVTELPESTVQPSTISPQLPSNSPETIISPEPKKSRKGLVLILALVLLIAFGGGAYWYLNNKKSSPKKVANQAVVAPTKFCYVRLAHLICVDNNGTNPVRYDLPKINNQEIVSLVPSPDQKKYLAAVNNQDNQDTNLYITDSNLGNPKAINAKEGQNLSRPNWSHDGKTIFVGIDTSANDQRQIYSYDITSDKFTQITKTGRNMAPYQLADGSILYTTFIATPTSSDWIPYTINPDGSNAKPYAPKLASNLSIISYDIKTDTVFFGYMNSTPETGKVTYFKANNPESNKSVTAKITTSGDSFTYLGSNILMVNYINGNLLDSATGKVITNIKPYGETVGMINLKGFKKSTQQKEQPHDRIVRIEKAPKDLQALLIKNFDAIPACEDPSAEVRFYVNKVVRNEFASVSEGSCEGGNMAIYAKSNGSWVSVTKTQMGIDCDIINKNKISKELIAQCYDAKGNSINNTNP
jgi:hypothetical protein